jgi:hypothetical protein
MPKIIFTSRYLKGGRQSGNLVRYIATREGVEAPTRPDASRPATENQPSLWNGVHNYVEYIARRPGAERAAASGHGLWNGGAEPLALSRVADEVARHKGPVWTHVASLRREDAERLGCNSADAWRAMVKAQIPVVAEAMKIPLSDLRWYAAFHNTGHHPHIHLMVYSVNPSRGRLTKAGIEKMRAAFAHDVFRHDLLHVYEQKDAARAQVNRFAEERLRTLASQIQSGRADPLLARQFSALSEKLKTVSGKKQYGYLQPEVKRMVDAVAAQLAADPRIAEMYRHWRKLCAEIRNTYTDEVPEPVPLTEEKTFRAVKNMIIRYALDRGELSPEQGAELSASSLNFPWAIPLIYDVLRPLF